MKLGKLGCACLLVVAGCSSDDGDSTTTSPTTSADTGGTSTSNGTSSGGEADTTAGSTGAATDTGSEQTTAASSSGAAESTGAMTIDTWESWALPSFFEVYCTHCHPGQSTRDFSVYDEVVANQVHIRCGVAPEALPDCDDHIEPGHLPIGDGPFPSDEDRWRLVDWIDAGMPRD